MSIPTPIGENYDAEYGLLDYRGKRVLDIGADYGSTAQFFLWSGAEKVIAVESNKRFYNRLVKNSQRIAGIVPVYLHIKNPQEVASLIVKFMPHIIKVDCEGCEVHLLNVPDWVFGIPESYVIETHTLKLERQFLEKFAKNGYTIRGLNPYAWWCLGTVKIITAQRIL